MFTRQNETRREIKEGPVITIQSEKKTFKKKEGGGVPASGNGYLLAAWGLFPWSAGSDRGTKRGKPTGLGGW